VAIANLSWSVDEATLLALITAGYDCWKVERGVLTVWTEISFRTTRPPLVENVLQYLYSDGAAPVGVDLAPNASYRAVPCRTSDGGLGTPITTVAKKRRGYVTPADVAAEGYANPPWTAEKVWRGIDRATATIDALCRQWFEPRYAQFVFDGTNHDQFWLDLPICALHAILQDDVQIDLADLVVYNRHLTRGQLNPDDRMNPKVTYSLDFPPGYRGRTQRLYADSAFFGTGRQNVVLKGVFGFTELGAGDFAAETAEGSQIPISYGSVPAEIVRAALLLTLTYMLPASDQQEAALESRLTSVQTRDQSMGFSAPSGADAGYGFTGNIEVDNILMRYSGPMRMGAAGK